MLLEAAAISAVIAPHVKKYVTDKAAKLASSFADKKLAQLYQRIVPGQKLQKAVDSFITAFDKELYSAIDNPTLTGPSYQDALKLFLADYDVLEALEKPLDLQSELDWDLLKRHWTYLRDSRGRPLIALPEDFDWENLSARYGKSLQKQALADPELRQVAQALADLETAKNTNRTAAATEQMAGPATGFDLAGYREFLKKKCSALQLAVMHTSTYQYDRKITLWSVFVPQSARESAPIPQMPSEIERRLRQEGHLAQQRDERNLEEFRQRYQASAVSPVLEILERARLAVVLGNPGSGKTSLLKYLALRWANEDRGPLPLLVDLREYIKEHVGLPRYFGEGCANYRLDAIELEKRLKTGEAAPSFWMASTKSLTLPTAAWWFLKSLLSRRVIPRQKSSSAPAALVMSLKNFRMPAFSMPLSRTLMTRSGWSFSAAGTRSRKTIPKRVRGCNQELSAPWPTLPPYANSPETRCS